MKVTVTEGYLNFPVTFLCGWKHVIFIPFNYFLPLLYSMVYISGADGKLINIIALYLPSNAMATKLSVNILNYYNTWNIHVL